MDESKLLGKCPYTTAQKVLSGKWPLVILHLLEEGPARFNALQRRLPNMTHATLSRQLKRMEEDGLIVRRDFGTIPPRVEYSLSPLGERFRPVLDQLKLWGMEYIAYMGRPRSHS